MINSHLYSSFCMKIGCREPTKICQTTDSNSKLIVWKIECKLCQKFLHFQREYICGCLVGDDKRSVFCVAEKGVQNEYLEDMGESVRGNFMSSCELTDGIVF